MAAQDVFMLDFWTLSFPNRVSAFLLLFCNFILNFGLLSTPEHPCLTILEPVVALQNSTTPHTRYLQLGKSSDEVGEAT